MSHKNVTKLRSTSISAAVAAALSVAFPLLMPNTVAAQGGALEEVIVTARKREENLQETPVAVTALDAESLREAGVRNLADLNTIVPNVEVSSGNGNSAAANIYIRGVGQRNTGVNIDSGVGIYIDDVYVGRPDGALLDLNDIQSVQVLRGPQGTLFGKNTTAGALVFTTNKPVDEFEGSVTARFGNYDRMDGEFVVNIPVTDSLFTRFSGAAITRDGYLDNTFDGEQYMDEKRANLIWQTRWAPNDDLTLDLNLNWADTDQAARPQKCQLVPEFVGWQAALFNTLAIVPSSGRTADDWCEEAQNSGDEYTITSDLGGEYKAENEGASLVVNWDINENLSFKSISAYRYTEASQDDELDHTGIPFLHRTQSVHPISAARETEQYSQEFQLTGSSFDDRMQWVAGAFWFQEESQNGIGTSLLGPFSPAIANLFFLSTSSTELAAKNDAVAVFGQVEWEFSDNWRTTLGLRYTDENRELERWRFSPDPTTLDLNGGNAIPVGGGLYAVDQSSFEYNRNFGFIDNDYTRAETSDDAFSPMASVQYLMDSGDTIDTGSIYFTYAEGFLSGGLSEAPTGELEEFRPEDVTNYELGVKLDMLDRSLRMNAALFYTDYKDRQLTTVVINPNTNSPAGATINAESSSIAGFELEGTWLPGGNWLINFNMTLTEGEIDTFDDTQLALAETVVPAAGCTRSDLTIIQVDSCPKDRSEENLPRLAEKTFFLAVQYNLETSLGQWIPRLQGSLKQDIEFCFDAASCETGRWMADEQFLLDGRVTWISPSGRWVGAIFGNNLTDETFIVGGTALVESQGVGGYAYNIPRTYGAEIQYSF